MEDKTFVIIMMLINTFLNVSGQLFLKSGMNIIKKMGDLPALDFFIKSFLSPFILIGLLFYFISLLLWLIVLSKAELSFAYPLISLSYVFVMFFSFFFLHESVGILRILGVFLIISGVVFVSRS